MDLHLNAKVIIVTNGENGIGEGVCRKLVDEGAIPCILDRSEKNMRKVVSAIKEEFGTEVFYVFTDCQTLLFAKLPLIKYFKDLKVLMVL